MIKLDIIIAVILGIFAFSGYNRGLIKTASRYLKFAVDVFIARFVIDNFYLELLANEKISKLVLDIENFIISKSSKVAGNLINEDYINYIVLFVLVFIISTIITWSIYWIILSNMEDSKLKLADKILGMTASVLLGMIVMMLIVFVFDKFPGILIPYSFKENLSKSFFVKYLYIYNIFLHLWG